MSQSEIICEEPWSHVVFRYGEAVYLTFLYGGVVETEHSVQLSESEAFAIKANSTFASELVRSLKSNPPELCARELSHPIWPSVT